MTKRPHDHGSGGCSHGESTPRQITRRRALQLGAAAGALPLLGGLDGRALAQEAGSADAVPAEGDALPQVPRRVLGKTGEMIPILLMGAGMGFDARYDPKLAEALRFGVNYIDAADCYANGTCESAVGAFHTKDGIRKKLWITSKSDKHDPAGFSQTVHESLDKLKTDYVDMYYLHALQDPAFVNDDLLATVETLKKEGKIKYFGFSCHDGNVAELLQLAAKTPWVDSVMFRYNFEQYGEAALNAAMDACAKSKVGLIAMKTQRSEASFADAWQKYNQPGKWNKFQAVLKAVWADDRITAAVSHMDNFDKLKQNIAAALDRSDMGQADWDALDDYAAATRGLACHGCDHICGPHVQSQVQIGATMRYLMYHDVYGERETARTLFAKLPPAARQLRGVDWTPANRACPRGFDVAAHMDRAAEVFQA